MRRYHRSPSVPFLIAGIKPVGSPLDSLNESKATGIARNSQNASSGQKTGLLAFLISLFLGAVFVGAGVGMEIHGMGHGIALQFIGIGIAAIGIIRCPEVE